MSATRPSSAPILCFRGLEQMPGQLGRRPRRSSHSAGFRAANQQLIQTRQVNGVAIALDEFMTRLVGADWQRVTDEQLPGSSTQMRSDAATFFDTDIPALLAWDFGACANSRVRCPVLYIGGTDSGPWFDGVRALMRSWFPDAEDIAIEGADHALAVTHPRQIAQALAAFLACHSS